jgi:hypothetical protein
LRRPLSANIFGSIRNSSYIHSDTDLFFCSDHFGATMRGMRRREFLTLGLGVAGLTAFTGTTALANDKVLRLLRPMQYDLHYINVSYQVSVERRYRYNYPRIERIEFSIRDRLINTLTTQPYNFSWVPIQADWGQGIFSVNAFSTSGSIVWSKNILITVTNLPPDISHQ